MPQVTIHHPDGTTESIPATVGYQFKRELQQMYKLTIQVERSQAEAVSLTRKQDEIELAGVKRGVLTDIDSGGTTWTLTVRSPEWYATQQAPILGGDKRDGDDNALISTLVGAVPEWSAGTIADLTGPMTFVFNHAFANEALREIEKNVPGELQWSGDGTVDYLSQVGEDQTTATDGTVSGKTVDVSNRKTVTFTLQGGAGGDYESGSDGIGGDGRYAEGEIDVSGLDEVIVYSAEAGADGADGAAGGLGWADGGDGAGDAGGGGAAAAITEPNGTVLAATSGGGGGGTIDTGTGSISTSESVAGGGGAEGGESADEGNINHRSGEDGEIVADVTQGGDGTTSDGGDAGPAYADSRTTLTSESLKSGAGTATVDASVTLTPDKENLENEIKITDRGRRLDSTHLRVIGAHEGEAQKFAQLVPQDDPNTYENEVRYNQPRWSSSDDTDWDRWENKDVVADNTIQEEAAALADELTETHVEAKATVSGEDLSVGDYVQVVKDDADIDRKMRIHRITTKTVQDTTAAVVDKLKLSTRTTVMDSPSDQGRDIQRFNTGFQGSSVVVQGGGSRQPVDAGDPAVIPFDYPALEFEHEAILQVRGLPYRAYSSGAASGGGSTSGAGGGEVTTSSDNADYQNTVIATDDVGIVTIPQNSFGTIASITPSSDTAFLVFQGNFINQSSAGANLITRYYDATDGVYLPDSNGRTHQLVEQDGTTPVTYVDSRNVNGHTIELQATSQFGSSGGDDWAVGVAWFGAGKHNHTVTTSDHTHSTPDHTHDPEPGIIEFGSTTPSGCDVLVNGATVATSIGSGTFETEIDISGELNKDAWNDIEITSDTLGHIQAVVSIDGYKQIGTR